MAEAETLRARLTRKPIVVTPGVYDAFTALMATQAGFATLYVSGAAIAYTRLGRPDIGLVSMSEVAETIALIRDRVGAHLIVDADTGYGNALNVVRTVRTFERAGASAIQLEDQDFPKRCGHLDGKVLIPPAWIWIRGPSTRSYFRSATFVSHLCSEAANAVLVQ